MSRVESVARAISIVESLGRTPAGLTETARRVDLPKSTVSRLLSTLQDLEVVQRDDTTGTYRLGPLIDRLPTSGTGPDQLAAVAHPYLDELTSMTGEAAGLAVPHGYRVYHVDQTEASQPVQVRDWTGEMVPMHVGPSGFCMMAYWPEAQLAGYLDSDLIRLTSNTVTDAEAIRAKLKQVRTDDYIWAFEEFVEGINSVAAPVLAPDDVTVGSLYVYGPAYRFPQSGKEDEVGAAVAESARRLSASLAV